MLKQTDLQATVSKPLFKSNEQKIEEKKTLANL